MVVQYRCNLCNKTWTHKGTYNRHLKRKTPCVKIGTDDEYKTLLNKFDQVVQSNRKLVHKVNNLEDKVTLLETQIQRQETTTNIYNTNTVNINISLEPFGREDLDFITDSDCKRILNRGFMSLYRLIEFVHFNENKPEYHNVYLPSKKDRGHVMVFDGKRWKLMDKHTVVDDLRANGIAYIGGKLDELANSNKLRESVRTKVVRFLDYVKNNDDYEPKINKEIELILYNNRDLVLNTKSRNVIRNVENDI